MNIDWSKAPEGTTHYHPKEGGYVEHWIKPGYFCVLGFEATGWISDLGHTPLALAIPMPSSETPWNGEGLPPVSTQCEALHKCGQWVGVKIIDRMVGSPSCACRDENDRLWWATEFRPARTDEQIAEDKRMHEIRNALTAIKASQQQFPNDFVRGNIVAATVEAMIDAGYRKPCAS